MGLLSDSHLGPINISILWIGESVGFPICFFLSLWFCNLVKNKSLKMNFGIGLLFSGFAGELTGFCTGLLPTAWGILAVFNGISGLLLGIAVGLTTGVIITVMNLLFVQTK
jgi:hypothetical protein